MESDWCCENKNPEMLSARKLARANRCVTRLPLAVCTVQCCHNCHQSSSPLPFAHRGARVAVVLLAVRALTVTVTASMRHRNKPLASSLRELCRY